MKRGKNIEMGKEEFRKVDQGLNLEKRGELNRRRVEKRGKRAEGEKKSSNFILYD